VPAEVRILFEIPYEERLASALELLGVNLANLADAAGHA
jgi:putative transcriptional regulator